MVEKGKTISLEKSSYIKGLFSKQNLINNVASGIVMLVLLGIGALSKEYLLLYLVSKAINIVTDILVK